MRLGMWLSIGIALALVPQIAGAQNADQSVQDQPTVFDDIIVDGRRLEDRAAHYTEQVSQQVPGRGLARWAGPVCIGVLNFSAEIAAHLADGLATAGHDLGVPIKDGPCAPNIFIVAASDGRELASQWVRREPREFRPNLAQATLSRSRLTDFTDGEAPVRWWAISRPTYYDVVSGRAIQTSSSSGGTPNIPVHSVSQKAGRTRDDLQRLVVIIDINEAHNVSAENLIAYLSLVSFSQVDMRADMSQHDTVLNLFRNDYQGTGLSEWDRAYLETLYTTREDQRINPHRQAERLTQRLRNERDDADAPLP